MKNGKIKRSFIIFIAVMMLMSSMTMFSSAASTSSAFEKSIANFPESYKPYLRELHEKYPNWSFKEVETGLDWSDAVESENKGETSLVAASAGSAFKSKESGDYDPDTNTYKQYDAGFVRANSLAVSYFMDPRNFLNESGIFQFEQLSFSSSVTVDVVEQVLEGSFMSDKKITYYNTSGKKKTLDIKYSEAIYNAGKKYNVNPCYLASKIINEVGVNGSGSTSGKYSGYEGYYNFYNIGATSSATPIKNGLKYAKGGDSNLKTYSRPWTDPEKAITGGAEFIAKGYIANGQDTGYFQRFNVSPDSDSVTYTHQYMTDISGAYFQSNTTYSTYKSLSMLSLKRTFKIPVYKNMRGADEQATSFSLDYAGGQSGTVTASKLYVRAEPNTNCDIVNELLSGSKVKILDKVMNTSGKYNFLSYPYWYHISFSVDNKTYTGYACADYIKVTTKKTAYKGNKVTLSYKASPSEKPAFISDNESVVRVNSDGSLTAVGEGTANIVAYTSKGLYDTVLISVSDTFKQVSGLCVKDKTSKSVTVDWSPVDGATGYEIYTKTGSGSYKLTETVTSSSYTFTNLSAGQAFSCKVRAYGTINGVKRRGEFSSSVSCSTYYKTLSSLAQSTTDTKSVKLKWNKVSSAYEYIIYKYNSSTGKYVKLNETTATSYTVSGLSAVTSYSFKVVARAKVNGNAVDYAGNKITVKTAPTTPTGLKVTSTTAVTAEIKWNTVKGAEKYTVYKLGSNGKYAKVATVKTASYKDTDLKSGEKAQYKVKAYSVSNGIICCSESSSALTLYTGPTKVKNLKTSELTSSSVTLSWSKKSGASGYYICKYNTSTKKYTSIAVTTKTSYSLEKLSSGTNYRYCVIAYTKINGVKYKGSYTDISFKTLPAKPTGLKFADATNTSYTLKWNAVKGADGYKVYKLQSNGKYQLLTTVKTNSCKVTNQKSATSAKYKIKAYIKSGNKTLYGEISSSFTATTLPNNVTSLKATKKSGGGYTLSWNKAARADGYMIYSYNTKTGKYVYVTATSSAKLAVAPKTSTKYKVASYVKVGNTKYESSGKTVSIKIG